MKTFILSITALIAANFAAAQGLDGMRSPFNLKGRAGGLMAAQNKQPITTSFADADTTFVLPQTFGDSLTPVQLSSLPRNEAGTFTLKPGFYEMKSRSYCIKAGTHGPSNGDAYLFAPLKGPKMELMQSILIKAEKNPMIPQQDVQLLLWAIIAKTKFGDFNPHMKMVTAMLLTPKQILELDGGALGILPKPVINSAIETLPSPIKTIIRAENEMRKMFSNANAIYSDFERLAVLAGSAPIDRPNFKKGRWSLHPDGYYLRYFPSSYSTTTTQIYVPNKRPRGNHSPVISDGGGDQGGSNAGGETEIVQIIFNAIGTVAVPSNTGSQRLLQSNQFR